MDPLFVAVEGIDGSGTTTCSKLLAKTLADQKIDVLCTKEPSDGTVGRHIRKILKAQESADEQRMFPLFLADRHDHLASVIRPSLEQGTTVICDRYAYSTWVYQQDNYEPYLIEYLQRACIAPDIVFFLICPVDECMRRLGERDVVERYEKREQQEVYHLRYKRAPRVFSERMVYLDSYNNPPDVLVAQMREEMGL